ncbi:MAG TPA: hypothetical protein VFR08_06235, partial [Candidatus Angelobacter sp.]|nr:hypothetical protein [Candidatus Angelobacter sp.]
RKLYELLGYTPERNYESITAFRSKMKEHRRKLVTRIAQQCRSVGAIAVEHAGSNLVRINNHLTADAVVVPFLHWSSRQISWGWCFEVFFRPEVDVMVAARLDRENENIESYYIIPQLAGFCGQFWVGDGAELTFLEAYRSRSLVPLLETVFMYDSAEIA